MKKIVRGEVNRLLKSVREERGIQERIEQISSRFLGLPYIVNSLGGGANLPERLTIMLDAFDCVTYIETVFALALAKTADEFEENLIRIRYKNSDVNWHSRNHYMVDWWRNNEREGLLKNITRGEGAVEKTRILNLIERLPEKRVTFRVFPKRQYRALDRRSQTGDFVCFATTKKNLDVYHAGILIRRNDEIMLRHASRSAGTVIDQDLKDFLRKGRMSGVIILRPGFESISNNY